MIMEVILGTMLVLIFAGIMFLCGFAVGSKE